MRKCILLLAVISLVISARAQWVSGGTQVSETPDDHHRPFVSAAADGGFYVSWQATDTTAAQLNKIRTSAYTASGDLRTGWPAGGTLATDSGDHYASQIITSEDGSAIIAWYGYPAGARTSSIYTQKYSISGTALWNGGSPVQVSTGGSAYINEYPIIVSDKHNGVLLTWTRFDSVIDFPSQDVIMQHIDSTGSVAAGWSATGTGVAVTPGVPEYYPQISLTPTDSSIYVIYADGYIGATSLMINKFSLATGALATSWTTAGYTVSSGPDVYPLINHDLWLYSDSSNNAIVCWIEARVSANGEYYQQLIDPQGNPILSTFGVLLAGNNANGISYLEIKQEADMDLLVAYNNLNTFNDVATMKVAPNATIIWNDTSNTSGGYSAYPYPASDGHGGMYAFYANTNTPESLYALALDSTGALYAGMTLPGAGFGTLGNYSGFDPNYDQNAIGTGNGNAVVAWDRQTPDGFFKIFACNIQSDLSTCFSPSGITTVMANAEHYILYPNPSSDMITLVGSDAGDKTITVSNVVGQTMFTTTTGDMQQVIDISAFPGGIYLVSISEANSDTKSVLKFVKE